MHRSSKFFLAVPNDTEKGYYKYALFCFTQILQQKLLHWVSMSVEKKVLSACDMSMGFLMATKHAERKVQTLC